MQPVSVQHTCTCEWAYVFLPWRPIHGWIATRDSLAPGRDDQSTLSLIFIRREQFREADTQDCSLGVTACTGTIGLSIQDTNPEIRMYFYFIYIYIFYRIDLSSFRMYPICHYGKSLFGAGTIFSTIESPLQKTVGILFNEKTSISTYLIHNRGIKRLKQKEKKIYYSSISFRSLVSVRTIALF